MCVCVYVVVYVYVSVCVGVWLYIYIYVCVFMLIGVSGFLSAVYVCACARLWACVCPIAHLRVTVCGWLFVTVCV